MLPEEPFATRDLLTRWFVIGKERFEKEMDFEKVLKALRSLKIHTNFTREAKASMSLRDKNVIEIDSEGYVKEQLQDEIRKSFSTAVAR